MTTILTEVGWEDENGNPLGTWTNQAELLDWGDEITVASDVVANTLGGDDTIIGSDGLKGIDNSGAITTGDGRDTISGRGFTGINNSGSIVTGRGHDTISGSAFGVEGILNSGTISTGNGNDIISAGSIRYGTAIKNLGTITTGDGSDLISGTAYGGILNEGTISTENGHDTISGSGGFAGITNRDTILTGSGRDTIIGSGMKGIINEGTISTGNGRDIVDAFNGGFDGGGAIALEQDNDLVRGFGQQVVDGGKGFDTAELGIAFDEHIVLGNAVDSSINITFNDVTMSFTDIEKFDFNGQEFTLEQLQNLS
jgi:hypothetical protein